MNGLAAAAATSYLRRCMQRIIHSAIAWKTNHEEQLFALFAISCMLPMLLPPYFMSYDGPAHLYNSRLLAQWWWSQPGWLVDYLFLQNEALPNWLTYPFLAVFGEWLGYFTADKLLQAVYAGLLLYGFRYLVRAFNPTASWSTWLGGVLVVHQLIGMYNFSFSIPLVMWMAGYYKRHMWHFSTKNYTVLLVFGLLLYFSHIIGFLVAGLLCGIWWLQQVFLNKTKRMPGSYQAAGFALLTLVFLPGIWLSWQFISARQGGDAHYFATTVLLERLWRMDSLVLFNTGKESGLLHWLLLLFPLAAWDLWKQKIRLSTEYLALLVAAGALLALYFVAPDGSMGASFTSARLQLFFWLCLFVLLAALPMRKRTLQITLVVSLVVIQALNWHYFKAWYGLSASVKNWVEASAHIPPQAKVLTLNYSQHWYHEHISNFLGLEGELPLMFENYEATNDYFPFRFQPQALENYRLLKPFLAWPPTAADSLSQSVCLQEVNTVVRWQYDPQSAVLEPQISSFIDTHFERYYQSENGQLELFRRKIQPHVPR